MLCLVTPLSRVQLFATPWTVALQSPLSMGILQARRLEWVVMPSSRGSSQPRDQTHISCIGRQIFYHLSHQGSPEAPTYSLQKGYLTTQRHMSHYWWFFPVTHISFPWVIYCLYISLQKHTLIFSKLQKTIFQVLPWTIVLFPTTHWPSALKMGRKERACQGIDRGMNNPPLVLQQDKHRDCWGEWEDPQSAGLAHILQNLVQNLAN